MLSRVLIISDACLCAECKIRRLAGPGTGPVAEILSQC